jgi:uncharacterized protein (TIGR03437 family)
MKNLFRSAVLLAAMVPYCSAATLAYSTYLRYGFTPKAMTSDAQGNLYLAGSAVIDPLAGTTSALIAKLDPTASRYLYLEYLDSAASDTIAAIAVDAAGNLYVTGTTSNPFFPVTGGSQLGAPPSGPTDTRAYVTKVSPTGVVLLSTLVGGSIVSSGFGIAVTPQGQILVSGVSGAGFAPTQGAFSVPDATNKWFLVELDATASKVIFSATGIGGSSIALDATGNIFLAGSSLGTNYPTTPGAYQTTLVQGSVCYGLCQSSIPGQLQHLTKVDPTGSKLIYSTGLNDPNGGAGSTVNTGLAVDAAGNAYVTGTLFEARYPFTTGSGTAVLGGFLTKVDPTGSSVVFSLPVGGGGVARDSSGNLYAAGTISTYNPIGFPGLTPAPVVTLPAALSWIPAGCVPNNLTATEGAYLLKLDSATGNVLDAQWIDGSSATASAATLVGTKLWTAGLSLAGDVPFTPGALAETHLVPGPLPGAFLSAADFSKPPAPVGNGAPVIACVLDGGNFMHAGPVAAYQIVSIFGANLGPATGVLAPDGTDPSIAGVTVTFDGQPAKMTYVSSSQINVLVPGPQFVGVNALPQSTVMQLSVAGTSIQREFAWTTYNLNLFADIAVGTVCPSYPLSLTYQPIALNPDGTRNTCTNPAKFGSLVSFFVHGVGTQQLGSSMPDTVTGIEAQAGSCAANVENVARSGIVYKVDVRLPATLVPCATFNSNAINPLFLTFTYNGAPVGPLMINSNPSPATPVRPQQIRVWTSQ